MSKSTIPVNQDSSGPKIATIKNASNEHHQMIVITNGNISDPQPISPSTEGTLSSIQSEVEKIGVLGDTKQLSIGDTSVEIKTDSLTDRRSISVKNLSHLTSFQDSDEYLLYYGFTSGVTHLTGDVLEPGERFVFDGDISIWGIIEETGKTVKVSVTEVK